PTEPSGFTELDFIPGQGTPAFGSHLPALPQRDDVVKLFDTPQL
ncbi:MAG: hypothetical protein, partial [Olavius algarvensis Gamma 3 endosymbiont]